METTPTTRYHAQPRRIARAENIGSLLRPRSLLEELGQFYGKGHTALLKEEREKDRSRVKALEDEAISAAVARQVDAGLDVITDGEFRRLVFFNCFFDSLNGLVPNDIGDLTFQGDDGTTVYWPGPPMAVDRLSIVDNTAAAEVAFLRSITGHPFKVTLPCASLFLLQLSAMWKPGVTDKVYKDREELLEHMMAIERELISGVIAAGCRYVQLDYPVYPHVVDQNWLAAFEQMGTDTGWMTEKAFEMDRAIVEGIPDDVTTGMHICRGNYRSRWLARGSLEPLAERIFELPYDKFLVEWDDQNRDGGYEPIRFVPKGRIMVMGIISSKKPGLESEDEVLRLMDAASKHLDTSQLAISCQCGFASGNYPEGGAFGNEVDEDTQWRKLELVARVADRIWSR
jgi:5-methyltetrahydropteroyltriglutamate--homocysteine methyltransferase